MSEAIRALYVKARLKPPNGKGIHKKKFHEMAVAIKSKNPGYSMSRAYAIAMSKLTPQEALKAGHRRR